MRRKLSEDEKTQIRAERLESERKWFPEFDIDVIVEDNTLSDGEPVVRIVNRGRIRNENS
jgi:hypothetical protein